MKTLVVYDSIYGNTEKVARSIGEAISGDIRVLRSKEVDPTDLGTVDTLIVGSPTLGGRPSEPIQDFLARLPEGLVKGIKVAAFDTRYSGKFVKLFGFAAERIASSLESKGGRLVSPPAAFYVSGKRGPLKEGELERASSWARELLK